MPPQKKAAPKLGPDAAGAGSGQPPWALVSPDGTDLYFPTTADNAQALAREFGAQPVDPSGFPWPSILLEDGTIDLGDAPKVSLGETGEQDSATGTPGADETASDAPTAPVTEQGGPTDQPAAPTPPVKAQPARRGSKPKASAADPGSLLSYCPSPAVCFPLGLPADVSHVACVHGSSS